MTDEQRAAIELLRSMTGGGERFDVIAWAMEQAFARLDDYPCPDGVGEPLHMATGCMNILAARVVSAEREVARLRADMN